MTTPRSPLAPVSPPSALLPATILIALGVLWGGATIIVKFVGMNGVPALGYAFWQTFGAGCLLLVVGAARRRPLPLTPRHLRYYLVMGWVGSAIPTTNMFYVLSKIPAGVMALVLATVPLLTYVVALGARAESFDLRRAIGIGLGFAGALLIVLPKGSLPSAEMAPFVALGFLSPVCFAITAVYAAQHRPPATDSLGLATGMMFASSLVLLPAALATGTFHALWAQLDLVNGLILVHIAIAALTFMAYFILLRLAGPVYFSQVAYIVTLAGVAGGMVIFGERHSLWVWAAIATIFAGVTLVNMRHRAGWRAGGKPEDSR